MLVDFRPRMASCFAKLQEISSKIQ
jgi:hypothetical protein